MSNLDDIEELLRVRGARIRVRATRSTSARAPRVGNPYAPRPRGADLADLRRREARQHKGQQITGAVLALAVLVGVGVITATVRSPGVSDVTAGGTRAAKAPPTGSAASGTPDLPEPQTTVAPAVTTTVPAPGAERPVTTGAVTPSSPATTSTRPAMTTSTTYAPALMAAPLHDIRTVNFADGFTYPADECGADPTSNTPMTVRNGRFKIGGADRLLVNGVVYGDALGDGHDDAIVLLTCTARSTGHAVVYTVDTTSASGVRRVARVEPDPATRAQLQQRGIVAWQLGRVLIDGTTVVSDWWARPANPATPAWTFTMGQRWTGTGWQQAHLVIAQA